jgi:hypothetical protein
MRFNYLKRRDVITLLGGAAAAWPLAARAQQGERMRRIGVFFPGAADDPEYQARNAAFLQGLGELGWTDGRNVRIDTRWGTGDADGIHRHAVELAALAPDVILAAGGAVTGPLLQATRTVPIVFVIVPDPVGAGFVDSLARPGGNATGFINFEYSISAKWLETAQADRAARDARGGSSRSRHTPRDRPVRRHPVGGAVARSGDKPGQRARRRRDRARHRGLRALLEWRPDRDGWTEQHNATTHFPDDPAYDFASRLEAHACPIPRSCWQRLPHLSRSSGRS